MNSQLPDFVICVSVQWFPPSPALLSGRQNLAAGPDQKHPSNLVSFAELAVSTALCRVVWSTYFQIADVKL